MAQIRDFTHISLPGGGTSFTVPAPDDTVEGDLLVLWINSTNANVFITPDTGWHYNQLVFNMLEGYNYDSNRGFSTIYYKVADASDESGATYTFNTDSTIIEGVVVAFSDAGVSLLGTQNQVWSYASSGSSQDLGPITTILPNSSAYATGITESYNPMSWTSSDGSDTKVLETLSGASNAFHVLFELDTDVPVGTSFSRTFSTDSHAGSQVRFTEIPDGSVTGSGPISFVGYETANFSSQSTWTIDTPTGLQEGDLVFIAFSDFPPSPRPDGWSMVAQATPSFAMPTYLYSRVATNSETSSYSFPMGTTRTGGMSCFAYRGVNTSNPIRSGGINSTGTANVNSVSVTFDVTSSDSTVITYSIHKDTTGVTSSADGDTTLISHTFSGAIMLLSEDDNVTTGSITKTHQLPVGSLRNEWNIISLELMPGPLTTMFPPTFSLELEAPTPNSSLVVNASSFDIELSIPPVDADIDAFVDILEVSISTPNPTSTPVPLMVYTPPLDINIESIAPAAQSMVTINTQNLEISAEAPSLSNTATVTHPIVEGWLEMGWDILVGSIHEAPPSIISVEIPSPSLFQLLFTQFYPDDGIVPVLRPTFGVTLFYDGPSDDLSIEIQYDDNIDFTSPETLTIDDVLYQSNEAPNTITLDTDLINDTRYYWRVRALIDNQPTQWTIYRQFDIELNPTSTSQSGSLNVVDTPATPTLLYSVPSRGKVGDEVVLVGLGINKPGVTVTVGGLSASVLSNTTVPFEEADVDIANNSIGVEHDEMKIVIPDVDPPGGAIEVEVP